MIHHDVNTFHMDEIYSQHTCTHPLTIHIQLATSPQFCNKHITHALIVTW
jgi:hypothetical protein